MGLKQIVDIILGTKKAGLTLGAQILDADGNPIASNLTTGFVEIGQGFYTWEYDDFTKDYQSVRFYDISAPTITLAMTPLSPEDFGSDERFTATTGNSQGLEVINLPQSTRARFSATTGVL